MACSVIYEDGKLKRVVAPNGEDSKLYSAIRALPEIKTDEEALHLWAQVYTQSFKDWFGDWETLAQAKLLFHNIEGMYQYSAEDHPEKFLFEIAIQANSSPQERSGAIKTVGEGIVELALKLFPDAHFSNQFEPVLSEAIDENGEPILNIEDGKNVFTNTLSNEEKPLNYNQPLPDALFNLKIAQKYSTIPELALSNLARNGFVTKFNPHDIVNEDRWYFNQSMGLDESQRRYHQYMSLNNLNRDMFEERLTSGGIPYLIPNRRFNLQDTIEENNERIHREKYEAIVDFFVDKFNISRDKINYITKSEFADRFPEQFHNNAQSVYSKGQFYFFTNNLTADITVEELLHPFIYTVKDLNPELFRNLLIEAQKSYPKLHQKIQVLYKSQPQSIRDQELVTQALSRVFNNVYENEEPQSFCD